MHLQRHYRTLLFRVRLWLRPHCRIYSSLWPECISCFVLSLSGRGLDATTNRSNPLWQPGCRGGLGGPHPSSCTLPQEAYTTQGIVNNCFFPDRTFFDVYLSVEYAILQSARALRSFLIVEGAISCVFACFYCFAVSHGFDSYSRDGCIWMALEPQLFDFIEWFICGYAPLILIHASSYIFVFNIVYICFA